MWKNPEKTIRPVMNPVHKGVKFRPEFPLVLSKTISGAAHSILSQPHCQTTCGILLGAKLCLVHTLKRLQELLCKSAVIFADSPTD